MQKKKPLDSTTLKHFRDKLLEMRRSVIEEARKMLNNFQQETAQEDPSSEAQRDTQWITECSLLTHEQELLNVIDAALSRIDDKTYGYCEETGEPLPLDRLEAYPMATLTKEAQQERERSRRSYYAPLGRHSRWH